MKSPSPRSAKSNPRTKPKAKPKLQTPPPVSASRTSHTVPRKTAPPKRPSPSSSAAKPPRAAGVPSRRYPAPSAPSAASAAPKTAAPRSQTKQAQLIDLLGTPSGASMAQMMALTGWQAHTVRGALSGALRKRLGLNVQGRVEEGERIYRLHSRPHTLEAASS